MNNTLVPPCSMTGVMKGDDRLAVLPFDINKVPGNLRDIVFNYLRSLQYLQLTIMEHVENERELAEIGEGMSQLEKQFQKLMVEIIPQSDEIRDLKYELALKNKDKELLLKDLQLEKERSKSSLLGKEIKMLNLKSQLTSLQNNVQ